MAPKNSDGTKANAEERFREAFHRLRDGRPTLLKPGSKVSQNNVAREAGCDPSALKKSRFPTLVAEIQARSIREDAGEPADACQPPSTKACPRCAKLKDELRQLVLQRDAAMSALVLADAHVLELAQRVLQLEDANPLADKVEPPPRLLR